MELKLRLVLDVVYEVSGPNDKDFLVAQLKSLPERAEAEGLLTGYSDCEVTYMFQEVWELE